MSSLFDTNLVMFIIFGWIRFSHATMRHQCYKLSDSNIGWIYNEQRNYGCLMGSSFILTVLWLQHPAHHAV